MDAFRYFVNTGFNLSILECKCTYVALSKETLAVLIYPYWNVNENPVEIKSVVNPSFNLSILECKFASAGQIALVHKVLIYPYWNVNEKVWERIQINAGVLIYPYWNVNGMDATGGMNNGTF